MPEQTRVHVMRHGEVHNPTGVLYGRLPGFRLSENGPRRPPRSPTSWPTATSSR